MSNPSFGEAEILVGSYIAGKVVVRGFYAGQAIFPRLTMTLGVSLFEDAPVAPMATMMPATGLVPVAKQKAKRAKVRENTENLASRKAPYQMTDITGELRLEEGRSIVANLFWTGDRHFVQATKRGQESHLMVACDLDFQRLEAIERWRQGKAPVFWVRFWPTLVASGEPIGWVECRAFQVKIPREVWLEFYAQVGGGTYDVIEVQFSAKEAEEFKAAVGQVRRARTQIVEGDYDGAVLTCRKGIEAIVRELPKVDGDDGTGREVFGFFREAADEKRAEGYAGIVSRLKHLMNIAAHDPKAAPSYGRDEAQFILRTTEALLALMGRFARKQ